MNDQFEHNFKLAFLERLGVEDSETYLTQIQKADFVETCNTQQNRRLFSFVLPLSFFGQGGAIRFEVWKDDLLKEVSQ